MTSNIDPSASVETPHVARVLGFDVARSLAMLAMFVVHFSLVAGKDRSEPAWMAWILRLFDGRASAMFMILAGIGITLMSRRAVASSDGSQIAVPRTILIRRGICLLALGFINLVIWPGDILRVYGVSLFLAAVMLTASDWQLLGTAGAFAMVFAILLIVGDFEQAWDWETLHYHGLWTPTGIVRNLFFDGFRSVFPWTGFVLYGMWLGRRDLANPQCGRRILIGAILVAVAAEGVSWGVVHRLPLKGLIGWDAATMNWLFGTESMPALPLFLLAVGGTATAVITACVQLTNRWPSPVWEPLVVIGQTALTWYFAHIVLGLGILVVTDTVGTEPLPVAAGYGVLFFIVAAICSMLWKRFFTRGPLESVLRTVSGG